MLKKMIKLPKCQPVLNPYQFCKMKNYIESFKIVMPVRLFSSVQGILAVIS